MDSNQLKQYIIEPTLKEFGLYSESAVVLLLGTCAVESDMGNYIHQIEGPALGIYQMEPATYADIWQNFLVYRKPLCTQIMTAFHATTKNTSDRMIYDFKYATLMCRLHYLRAEEQLPSSDNIEAMAIYWKQYYNTEKGKGTIKDFMSDLKWFTRQYSNFGWEI